MALDLGPRVVEIPKSLVDDHYENEFEFPLLKLIMQVAEEKNISYAKAALIAVPEYAKTIRYGDKEFYDDVVQKRAKEIEEFAAKRAAILAQRAASQASQGGFDAGRSIAGLDPAAPMPKNLAPTEVNDGSK